jgi:hypothetical protein
VPTGVGTGSAAVGSVTMVTLITGGNSIFRELPEGVNINRAISNRCAVRETEKGRANAFLSSIILYDI